MCGTIQLKVWASPLADKLSWGKVEESRKGRMADALAHPGEEGRDKLRKAAVRCK